MTKEEEIELLNEVLHRESSWLEACWSVSWVLDLFRKKRRQGTKRFRVGMIEEELLDSAHRSEDERCEIAELLVEYRALEEIRQRIVCEAERIVPGALRRIVDETPIEVTVEELEDLAKQGLYRAVRLIDPARGLAYRTYARWWIKALCNRYIDAKEIGKEWVPMDDVGRIIKVP